jgi:hypothetical protein
MPWLIVNALIGAAAMNGTAMDETKGQGKKFAKVQRSLLCNSRFNPFCDGVKAKLLDERLDERFD